MSVESSVHSSSPAPIPWRIRLLTTITTSVADLSRRRDGTVNRPLFSFLDRKSAANPNPVAGVSSSDHTIDSSRNLSARLFSPSSSQSLPVVVYFHGGGFCFHSAGTIAYDALCRRLAGRIPARVLSVEYRLAPECKYPAQCDDGVDAVKWLDHCELIPEFSAVFLAGDSAGGNIAHHVMRRLSSHSPPETPLQLKRVKLVGLVAIQPFFGGEVQTESEKRLNNVPFSSYERFKWMWRAFLPVGSNRDHEACNVFGLRPDQNRSDSDWTQFPPTMIVIGGWDALQDRQRSYVEGLKRVGVLTRLVEYSDAIHGFFVFPELADSKRLVDDVADFVKERIGSISSYRANL
ncbi:hypothetical protein LUZ60_007798 [Juncus effusus]|nr:hypothetical protein LUZ60_007798 [Juncus effusus]